MKHRFFNDHNCRRDRIVSLLLISVLLISSFFASSYAQVPFQIKQTKQSSSTSLKASPTTMTVGEQTTLTAAISPSTATGMVTFQWGTFNVDGIIWNAITQVQVGKGGSASTTWKPSSAGSFSVRAMYGGDTTYNGSTSNTVTLTVQAKIQVKKGSTTSSLTASPTTIFVGESTTLKAQISVAVSTGSVTFQYSVDGKTWNKIAAVTPSSGVASTPWKPSSIGQYSVSAIWSGDDKYEGSTSNTVTLTVQAQSQEVTPKLIVKTDKLSYSAGESTIISGTVSPVLQNTPIKITIFNPNNVLYAPLEAIPTRTGSYSLTAIIGGKLGINGVYTVKASYSSTNAQTTFTFTLPDQESESIGEETPEPTQPEESSQPQREISYRELQKEPTLKRIFVLGEVMIGLMEEVDPDSEEVRELIEEINGTVIEVIEQINVLRIGIAEGAEQEALNTLQSSDLVRFASRNKYLVPTSVEVSDPDFSWQTDHYQMIKLPEAWSASMGSGEVIVAIIDSGIELSHPDLQDNIWTGDDICDDGSDDDLNGFIDDCNGWNFAQSNNDTQDEGGSWPRCNGHGTHVAGIVGASNNQEGGIGVAPHVTLMPVKVSSNLDIDGDIVCASTEAIVAQAIIYAADNGASVINASLGCPNGEKCDMPSVGDAFLYATQKGSVVVVAAGNERETSEGIDDWQDYADYIIEVSSVDLSEEIAGYSNSGPGIKISAPGTTVYSTKIEGRYGIKTGTSQAAPMVSGCAALLLSFDRSLTNVDIEQILLSSARDIGGTGWDELFGFGVLDCSNALNLVGETLPELQLPGYSGSETGDAGGEEEFDESDEEQQSTELEPQQAGISVAMKHKKKVTLAAVKNEGELPIFGIELRILDGTIKFVKSRGWDRDRIDQKTVLVNTADRPIQPGSTAIILLIVDSRISPFEWRALDEYQEAAAMGSVTPR